MSGGASRQPRPHTRERLPDEYAVTAFWDLLRSFCTTPSRLLLAVTPTTTYDMTTIEKRREKKPTPIFCEKPHKNMGGSKKRPALTTRVTELTTPSEAAAADDAPLDLD